MDKVGAWLARNVCVVPGIPPPPEPPHFINMTFFPIYLSVCLGFGLFFISVLFQYSELVISVDWSC